MWAGFVDLIRVTMGRRSRTARRIARHRRGTARRWEHGHRASSRRRQHFQRARVSHAWGRWHAVLPLVGVQRRRVVRRRRFARLGAAELAPRARSPACAVAGLTCCARARSSRALGAGRSFASRCAAPLRHSEEARLRSRVPQFCLASSRSSAACASLRPPSIPELSMPSRSSVV